MQWLTRSKLNEVWLGVQTIIDARAFSIATLLLGACLFRVGCESNSSSHMSPNREPELYPRGALADAGSVSYRGDLPDFDAEIPELVLKHHQARGDHSQELASLGAIFDVVAESDDGARVPELKQLIEPLAESLQSPIPKIRRQSALALEYVARNLGSEAHTAIEPLMDLVEREMTSPNQEATTFALNALGFIGSTAESAVPLLIERLANAEAPQSFTAAEALGRIRKSPEVTVPALNRALEPHNERGKPILGRSEYELLYEYAAIALGCFGSDATTAAPRLIELLQSRQDGHQRKAFLQALCRIGSHSEQAIPALVKVIGELKQRRSKLDDEILPYAIDALCSYGEPGKRAAINALTGTRYLIIISPAGRRWHRLNPCAKLVYQQQVLEVVAKLSSLENLQLIGEFDDSALQSLKEASNLKQLYLPTESKLASHAYLPNLKSLELLRCSERPTVEALRQIAQLPKLSELIIPNSELQASDLSDLPAMPQLRSLDIYGIDCGGGGLRNLSRFPSLQRLRLGFPADMRDADLEHLRQLADLRELILLVNSVGDPGVKHIKQLTKLRRLGLHHTAVSDAGLIELATLANLEELSCVGSRITRDGAARFQRRMPNLDRVDFGF